VQIHGAIKGSRESRTASSIDIDTSSSLSSSSSSLLVPSRARTRRDSSSAITRMRAYNADVSPRRYRREVAPRLISPRPIYLWSRRRYRRIGRSKATASARRPRTIGASARYGCLPSFLPTLPRPPPPPRGEPTACDHPRVKRSRG